MKNPPRTIWFEGSNEIHCSLEEVKDSIANLGKHFSGIISLMPGMKEVELIENENDYVTIKTNEGLMKRTNISVSTKPGYIELEFDEAYQAGKTVTTNAHFSHRFEMTDSVINHRLVISNLTAPGFMGFLYRNFGSSNMGKAFMETYKNFLETITN
jgi:carbon monoxide dehydrogenase subunit G